MRIKSNSLSPWQADDLVLDLNRRGVSSTGTERVRIRARAVLGDRLGEVLFILPIWPDESSPYRLEGDSIYNSDGIIATINQADFDDAVLAYERKNGAVITLNTNSRSSCTGCVFCHYSLEVAQDPYLHSESTLREYVRSLVVWRGLRDLSHVERVGVSTGCFREESAAVQHLVALSKVLREFGFDGTIQFLTSVLRTRHSLRALAQAIPNFHITLTIECLENRSIYLKESKASLSAADAEYVMRVCAEFGIGVDFTYIIGLDRLDSVSAPLETLCALCSEFPKIQVFQAHANYARPLDRGRDCPSEYYGAFKRFFEKRFFDSGLRPEHWQNYRSPWCFAFGDERLPNPLI